MARLRVGEALIRLLEQMDVDTIFGIPGIHTIELYRGLAASPIRHVTPRHEQGAAFMADGYARVTGKPGVCLLITGPGFTNALTSIAQARADSIPMLIISGINARDSLGKQLGHLHELPDQTALSRTACLETHTLLEPERLGEIVTAAFKAMTRARPGPVHIEIPTDVMALEVELPAIDRHVLENRPPSAREADIRTAATICQAAKTPLILAGGGVKDGASLQRLAAALAAPVVTTVNARGLMAGHALNVPASATLKSVRDLIEQSDLVLALGTEVGPTDYDMYGTGALPAQANMIRVDIEPEQFARRDDRGLMIEAERRGFRIKPGGASDTGGTPWSRAGGADAAGGFRGDRPHLSSACRSAARDLGAAARCDHRRGQHAAHLCRAT